MNLVIAKPSVLNHSILLQMSHLLQKHAATASKVSLIALACLTLVASLSAANSKLESNNPFLPFGHTPGPAATDRQSTHLHGNLNFAVSFR